MTTLKDEDEAALLGLPRHAGADNVRQVLREIAGRHAVDWRTWPDWSCGLAGAQVPLSMAITKLDSDSYFPIIEFAFGPFCRLIHDVADVRALFKRFFDDIGMLMGFNAAPGGDADYAGRIQACFAAFLAAAGGEGRSYAFASLTSAFPVGANDWLDDAWRVAASAGEGDEIYAGLTTLGAEADRDTL